jgi:hypothetical protein
VKHRAYTTSTAVDSTEDGARPDSATRASRTIAVTVTPVGRDRWRGTPQQYALFITLTRTGAKAPWKVSQLQVLGLPNSYGGEAVVAEAGVSGIGAAPDDNADEELATAGSQSARRLPTRLPSATISPPVRTRLDGRRASKISSNGSPSAIATSPSSQ